MHKDIEKKQKKIKTEKNKKQKKTKKKRKKKSAQRFTVDLHSETPSNESLITK